MDDFKIVSRIDFKQLQKDIEKAQQMIAGARADFGSEGVRQSNRGVTQLNSNVSQTNSLFDSLKKNVVDVGAKVLQFFLISGTVASFFKAIRKATENVFAFDKAMTNVNLTMDLSNEENKDFIQNSLRMADSLHASTLAVLEAQQVFSNMNETLSSVNEKVQATIILANLTGASVSQMADSINSLVFQFDLSSDSAGRLADVLVVLAQQTSTEFRKSILDMSQAVQISGSVAEQAGFSYEEFLATISTLSDRSRLTGRTVSAGLTTILSRLTRVSDSTGATISDLEKALNSVGVRLRDTNGQFLSSFDVLQRLSGVYDQLTDSQASEIAFLVAGTRQRKIFNVLMKEFGTIQERVTSAQNANGEASEKQKDVSESLAGILEDLKNSYEAFSHELLNTNSLKQVLKFIVSITDSMTILARNFDIALVSLTGFIFGMTTINGVLSTGTVAMGGFAVATSLALPVVGAIGLAVAGATALFIKHKESIRDAELATADLKKAQDELASTLETGTREQLEEVIQDIEDFLSKKKELEAELASINLQSFDDDAGSIGLDTDAVLRYKEVSDEIDVLNESLVKLKLSSGTTEDALEKLKDRSEELKFKEQANDAFEAVSALDVYKKALDQLNTTGEISSTVLADLIIKNADLAEEILIDADAFKTYTNEYSNLTDDQLKLQAKITDATIQEVALRIGQYRSEIVELDLLIKKSGELTIETEKRYLNTQRLLANEVSRAEESVNRREAINSLLNKQTKKSSEFVSKLATRYFSLDQAIKALNTELSFNNELLNQVSGDERSAILEEQIRLTGELIDKTKLLEAERGRDLREQINQLNSLNVGITAGIDPTSNKVFIDNLNILESLSGDTAKEVDTLVKSITKLDDSFDKTTVSLLRYNTEQRNFAKEIAKNVIRPIERQIKVTEEKRDKVINALEAEIKANDKLIAKYKDRLDSEIEQIQSTIDAQKDKNKSLEDELKLQRELDELAKLRQERANIEAEKNVQLFTGEKFEFVADPRALRDVDERITDQQQTVDDLRREQRQSAELTELEQKKQLLQQEGDAEIQALEDKKIRLQDELNAEQRSFEERLEKLQSYVTNYNAEVEAGGEISSHLLGSIYSELSNIQGDYYAGGLKAVVEYVDQYNRALSMIQDGSVKYSGGSTSGGRGSSGSSSGGSSGGSSQFSASQAEIDDLNMTRGIPHNVAPEMSSSSPSSSVSDNRIVINNMNVKTNNAGSFARQLEGEVRTGGRR